MTMQNWERRCENLLREVHAQGMGEFDLNSGYVRETNYDRYPGESCVFCGKSPRKGETVLEASCFDYGERQSFTWMAHPECCDDQEVAR